MLPMWLLKKPVSAVIFDCDGTLSTIEGIDELAKANQVGPEVAMLTATAMGQSGLTPALYQARLEKVQPRQEQLLHLGEQYYAERVTDALAVIQTLKRLQKSIYLFSAGLRPAVAIFAAHLGIPESHIYAVGITFTADGRYLAYEQESPLVRSLGKQVLAKQLQTRHADMVAIGDGLNDVDMKAVVTRFIGYGGVFYRPLIASCCDFYINTRSLAALLPFCLTHHEYLLLNNSEKTLYHLGLDLINEGKCKFPGKSLI